MASSQATDAASTSCGGVRETTNSGLDGIAVSSPAQPSDATIGQGNGFRSGILQASSTALASSKTGMCQKDSRT